MNKSSKGQNKREAKEFYDELHDYAYNVPEENRNGKTKFQVENKLMSSLYQDNSSSRMNKLSTMKEICATQEFKFFRYWSSFSKVTIELILSFLDFRTQLKVSMTCKNLNKDVQTTFFWTSYLRDTLQFDCSFANKCLDFFTDPKKLKSVCKSLKYSLPYKIPYSSETFFRSESQKIRDLAKNLVDFVQIKKFELSRLCELVRPAGAQFSNDLKMSWDQTDNSIIIWMSNFNPVKEQTSKKIIQVFDFKGQGIRDVYFLSEEYIVIETIKIHEEDPYSVKSQIFTIYSVQKVLESTFNIDHETGISAQVKFLHEQNENYGYEVDSNSKQVRIQAPIYNRIHLKYDKEKNFLFYTKEQTAFFSRFNYSKKKILQSSFVPLKAKLDDVILLKNIYEGDICYLFDEARNIYSINSTIFSPESLKSILYESLENPYPQVDFKRVSPYFKYSSYWKKDELIEYVTIYYDEKMFYLVPTNDIAKVWIKEDGKYIEAFTTLNEYLYFVRNSSIIVATHKNLNEELVRGPMKFNASKTYGRIMIEGCKLPPSDEAPSILYVSECNIIYARFFLDPKSPIEILVRPQVLLCFEHSSRQTPANILSYQTTYKFNLESNLYIPMAYTNVKDSFRRHLLKVDGDKLIIALDKLNFFVDFDHAFKRQTLNDFAKHDYPMDSFMLNTSIPNESSKTTGNTPIKKNPYIKIPEISQNIKQIDDYLRQVRGVNFWSHYDLLKERKIFSEGEKSAEPNGEVLEKDREENEREKTKTKKEMKKEYMQTLFKMIHASPWVLHPDMEKAKEDFIRQSNKKIFKKNRQSKKLQE